HRWIDTGNRRYVNFTKLSPGQYTFSVRGSNNDNLWNNQGTSLTIEIIPPFWMTGWFKSLMLLLFAVVSYFVIGLARRYSFLFTFWKKKSLIGHYKLTDKIASGGMGIIYRAEDVLDQSRSLALKVMKEEYFADKDQVKRFKNEGAIIDQLNHPNIIKIVERGEHQGQLYMAMELVEGQNLADFLQTEKQIETTAAAAIILQITNALTSIHKKNIIHRDLKPENIMITRKSDNPYFVTLLDFGLARSKNLSRLTQTGMVMGTVFYISPEQVTSAEVSFACDVYSLGVICFEIFTGKKPFDGPSNETIFKDILGKEPMDIKELRPDIPPQYSRTIMAMLSKKPGDRPTMEEILESFQLPGVNF
ncbi:MAG: protein kinase, partial [bacterium]|nr:protein kinase [bacterium]